MALQSDPDFAPGGGSASPTVPELPHELWESAKVIPGIMTRWRNPWARQRFPMVQAAILNHNFLNGYQYTRVDSYGRTFAEPKRYRNQVRLVNNVLRPITRTIISQLTKNKPVLDAVALSSDYQDEAAADVANKLLKHLQRITEMERKDQQLWLWLMKGGTSFKRVMWNPTAGPADEIPAIDAEGLELFEDTLDGKVRNQAEIAEIIADSLQEDPLFDPGERFMPILVPSAPGEVEIKVLSCMQVLAEAATEAGPMMKEVDKLITEHSYSLDFIRQKWPDRGKYVQPENNSIILWDSSGSSQVTPGVGMPSVTGFTEYSRQESPPRAVVRELFIRPTEKNPLTGKPAPLGVHFVWAGGVPLTDPDTPLPYAITPQTPDHDLDFDMTKYDWFLEPSFWSSPMLTDILPLQRSFNRRRSQINESINAFVHPKLAVPMGSKIKKSAFSDVAGEKIEYAGVPPSYLNPPSVQQYVFNSMEMDLQQINDVAMTHEALRQGRPPPQVRTAAGLRFLQEADNAALAGPLRLFEAGESVTAQKMLDRVKQFYPDERTIEYIGESNRVEVGHFERAPFFQNRWQVSVMRDSTFPDSRAAKVAEANEMLQFAPWMMMDPQTRMPDRRLYARLIGRADLDDYIQEMDESRQTQENEYLMMLENPVPIPVEAYEDHAEHIKTLMPKIQSMEFKLARMQQEPWTIAVLQHLQMHEQRLPQQQQMMSDASNAMAKAAQDASINALASNQGAQAGAAAAMKVVEGGSPATMGNGGAMPANQQGGQPTPQDMIGQLIGRPGPTQ